MKGSAHKPLAPRKPPFHTLPAPHARGSGDEQNHGMCRPGGCTHWFLKRGGAQALLGAPGDSAPWYAEVPGIQSPAVLASTSQSSQNLLVVLPQKLIDFECHGANPDSPLARKANGQWCGPPGCLDMGTGGFVVVHQWIPQEGGVGCLLERKGAHIDS